MRNQCTRKKLRTMVLESWGDATPVSGKYVVGRTKKGDALVVPKRPDVPLSHKVLREMFLEAKALGLDGRLNVYGSTSLMSESGRFRFTQVDVRSCKILF